MPGRVRKLLLNGFVAQVVVILAFLALFVHLALQQYTIHDFVCYWSSAHLLAGHHNPYDPAAIQQLEVSLGTRQNGPAFIMRNPPWILPFIVPLGWFPLRISILLWAGLMLSLASIACWLLTRDAPDKRDVLIFFVPLLLSLWNGQSTIIVLFAVAFFICLRSSWPFTSGMALSLAVIKPHLLVIFWPILAVDCVRRREWRVPAGLLSGVVLLTAFAWGLDPHAWTEYRLAMDGQGIGSQFLPNISAELRFLFFPRLAWVQLTPSLLGVVAGLVWYFRIDWDWAVDGPVVIAASAVLSPYSWTYDLVLVLPAVLTFPYSREIRDTVIMASLLTIGPLEYAPVWASPQMSFAGVVWVAWYLVARLVEARKAQNGVGLHAAAVG